MFHKVKNVSALPGMQLSVQFAEGATKVYDASRLPDRIPTFRLFHKRPETFYDVEVDVGGHGIVWNDDLDLSCDELWENGELVNTPFDGLMALSEATDMWGLSESTLRKAIAYGKLADGLDVRKFGKQWVVATASMLREYGEPAAATA